MGTFTKAENSKYDIIESHAYEIVGYDPIKKIDPDVTLSAEEREVGGLGIFLVKKTMDDVSYEYKNGQNILKIKKAFSEEGNERI